MPKSADKLAKPELIEKNGRRIFSIIWRLTFAILIIVGAVFLANKMISNKAEPPQRQARERSFTVAVIKPEIGSFSPFINASGEIIASKTLDIRAQVSGEIIDISDNLMVGGFVSKGEQILQIDPFNYEGALSDTKAALSDAQLQLTISKEQTLLEKINLNVANTQLQMAQHDLERAVALNKSGSLTDKDLENSEFLISQREQVLEQRKSSIIVQQTSMKKQENAILRAKWALEKAQNALDNTRIISPFDGVVISKTAELGRVLTANEIIAKLYEQNSLEVSFTLSDSQYGYLLKSGLIGREVIVNWDIEPNPIILMGEISRIGAQVNALRGGVEVFASLKGKNISDMKPGTFVEVEIAGLLYENSYSLPETALYENSHIYVFDNGRMKRIDAELLVRDGENVIIRADIAIGQQVITTRLAQAGDGLKVSIEGQDLPPREADKNSSQTLVPNSTETAPQRVRRN